MPALLEAPPSASLVIQHVTRSPAFLAPGLQYLPSLFLPLPLLLPDLACGLQYEKLADMHTTANRAIQIFHHKLQKERKAVARLQEEKCTLQARLLNSGGAGDGSHPQLEQQLARLLQEVAAGRERIEALLQERAVLSTKLEAVAAGTPKGHTPSHEQRKAAAAALAALQQQQEAAATALREELAAERERNSVLAEERAALEARLQEAVGRLGAAEQISGHLEQVGVRLARGGGWKWTRVRAHCVVSRSG